MGPVRFRDRSHAGATLADALDHLIGQPDVLVLGLPRGGVPVGAEIANALGAPLDVLVVRKLGVPGQEELAMGAVAGGGICVRNDDIVRHLRIDEPAVEQVIRAETQEVARRDQAYRPGRPPRDLAGKTVILVDDGLATGATMRAALAAVRSVHPRSVVVAVGVGAADTCRELGQLADEVVCPSQPADLGAVGRWYDDFSQVTDAEVRDLLAKFG